jgi:hypothetical protein
MLAIAHEGAQYLVVVRWSAAGPSGWLEAPECSGGGVVAMGTTGFNTLHPRGPGKLEPLTARGCVALIRGFLEEGVRRR